MRFVREKKIYCGPDYVEVDIIPRTWEADLVAKRGTRSKKQRESAPKQRNLNEKNAKRYLRQLGNGNFTDGDWFISLSYKDKFKPATMAAAEKEVANYLRRLKNRYKKLGHELKYILVNEGGTTTIRFNHQGMTLKLYGPRSPRANPANELVPSMLGRFKPMRTDSKEF